MAYNMTKMQMHEHLKEDAAYFPFVQLESYKLLQKQSGQIYISADVFEDYVAFFADVRRECYDLVKREPHSENVDLWNEAIREIDKAVNHKEE